MDLSDKDFLLQAMEAHGWSFESMARSNGWASPDEQRAKDAQLAGVMNELDRQAKEKRAWAIDASTLKEELAKIHRALIQYENLKRDAQARLESAETQLATTAKNLQSAMEHAAEAKAEHNPAAERVLKAARAVVAGTANRKLGRPQRYAVFKRSVAAYEKSLMKKR